MTRATLLASSMLLAGVGFACLFVPTTSASALNLPEGSAPSLPLAAPASLGIAAMNAIGRGAIYGGIYGRPIVLANFLTAGIATMVLVALQRDSLSIPGGVLTAAFAVYWLASARLLFRPPFDTAEDRPPGPA